MMSMTIYGGRKAPKRLSTPAEFNCPTCQNYAYHGSSQQPVRVGQTKHHPACVKVEAYMPTPKSPIVAVAGFFEKVPFLDRIVGGVEDGVAKVSGVFGPDQVASGNELVAMLSDAINQLNIDIQQDGCGDWYDAGCTGSVPAVDDLTAKINAFRETNGTAYSAADALRLAGVPQTAANISAWAACTKAKESGSKAIPTGTAAFCALQVRDATSGEPPLLPKAHTTPAFRDRWTTFLATWARFQDKWTTAANGVVDSSMQPTENDLKAQMTQYNTYRQQFLDGGGTTSAPSLGEPMNIFLKIGLFAAGAAALYFGGMFLYKKYVPV